jgi:hypothetical protein
MKHHVVTRKVDGPGLGMISEYSEMKAGAISFTLKRISLITAIGM